MGNADLKTRFLVRYEGKGPISWYLVRLDGRIQGGGAIAQWGYLRRSSNGDKERLHRHHAPQLRNKDQETFNRALWAMRGKDRLSELNAGLEDGDEVQFFLSLAGG